MKILIFLSVIFAAIYSIQATKLELDLHFFYDQKESTNGKIDLTLNGRFSSKVVTFNQTFIEEREPAKRIIEFSEDVLNVTINWKPESKKPLYLFFLTINTDKSIDTDFYFMYTNIESGSSMTFKKLDDKNTFKKNLDWLKLVKFFISTFYLTNTRIIETLHGELSGKVLTFDKSEFHKYNFMKMNTDFPEEIKSVQVHWQSKSKQPIVINYLMVYSDNDEIHKYFSLERTTENETSENFDKIY